MAATRSVRRESIDGRRTEWIVPAHPTGSLDGKLWRLETAATLSQVEPEKEVSDAGPHLRDRVRQNLVRRHIGEHSSAERRWRVKLSRSKTVSSWSPGEAARTAAQGREANEDSVMLQPAAS